MFFRQVLHPDLGCASYVVADAGVAAVVDPNPEIHPREASSLLEAGDAVALDVREPSEWKLGHIRHALHIPLGELGQRLHELPEGRRIVAVCRSDNRSIVNLAGGLSSWHAHGLPLEPATGEVA